MEIKKGSEIIINTPARDEYTPAESEKATVKTVFKSGNIKVVNEYGTGYTLTPRFFEIGGTVEVIG